MSWTKILDSDYVKKWRELNVMQQMQRRNKDRTRVMERQQSLLLQ